MYINIYRIVFSENPIDWKIQELLNLRYRHETTLKEILKAIPILEQADETEDHRRSLDCLKHDRELHQKVISEASEAIRNYNEQRSTKQLTLF